MALTAPQALLLCAGLGARFDPSGQQFKLLAPLPNGNTVATQSALNLLAAGYRPLALVRDTRDALAEALTALGCEVHRVGAENQGLGDSIATGVRLSPSAHGWLICLADMPAILPSTFAALAQQIQTTPDQVIAPRYQGQRGHPVYLPAQHRERLLHLQGDQGPRELFQPNAHPVLLEVDDAGVVYDIDLPSDLASDLPRNLTQSVIP